MVSRHSQSVSSSILTPTTHPLFFNPNHPHHRPPSQLKFPPRGPNLSLNSTESNSSFSSNTQDQSQQHPRTLFPAGYKRLEIKEPDLLLQLCSEGVLNDKSVVLDASDKAVSKRVGTVVLDGGEATGGNMYEAAASTPSSSYSSSIQIVKTPGWSENWSSNSSNTCDSCLEEFDWTHLEADLYHWTKTLRAVQWYPGHIAKAEKELREQLKLMDVVIEVRDARIPMSTSHPQMESWLGSRKRILVLNREDMISTADRNAWAIYYARQGTNIVFSNGQFGMGTMKLGRLAKALAAGVNVKRRAKGLLPRPVRAGIVGYPNVGKSSLINRLLKRRMCPAAPRPGVTRELRWVRFGKDLEFLDSPGILPMRISDQSAAIKLAICDDIGERSYDVADVAAILVQMLSRLPAAGNKALYDRYKIDTDGHCGKTFVRKLALQLFSGDVHHAAFRVLSDFRKGKFGWIALERPPG